MSSITGPSLGSELPRTILPMEVIMVSRYTSPVVSSFTTQLELTLERLGFNTIPMDIVPTGVSQSTSTSSRVLKQATTLAKPRGGVGGLTYASVLAGRGDFGGDGAFGDLDGGPMEVVCVDLEGPSLCPAVQLSVGGFPLWLPQVGRDVLLCPPPSILLGLPWYGWCLWGGSGTRGISGSGSRS